MENTNQLTDPIVESSLQYLETYFDEYPFDRGKDKKFFIILYNEFPSLDILSELKLFHTWIIDKGVSTNNPRLSFRKWLNNTIQWQK